MKVLVVFSHPNPRSFNAAILDVVKEELEKKGAELKIKDLYAMNWQPILSASDFQQLLSGKVPADIAAEQADVLWADLLVIISPIWWYSVPAMLKGYIDRVLLQGFAYRHTASGPEGLLKGKKALLLTTSGADEHTAKITGMMDSINTSLVEGIFNFCGFAEAKYKNSFAVPLVSDEIRKEMLEDIRNFVQAEV